MTDDDRTDARLAALLAVAEAEPDEAFVARVQRAVLAEQRMAAARSIAWRRFAVEALASAAVATAFVLLGRLAPLTFEFGQGPLSPAAIAALVLAIWFGVELRPAAAER